MIIEDLILCNCISGYNKRSKILFSFSVSKLPSPEARSRVTDHYYHRPRRFFGFNSGTLFKTYLNIFPVILVEGSGRKKI